MLQENSEHLLEQRQVVARSDQSAFIPPEGARGIVNREDSCNTGSVAYDMWMLGATLFEIEMLVAHQIS